MKSTTFTRILVVLTAGFTLAGCQNTHQSEYAYASDEKTITRGNQLFDNYCVACHNFETTGIGPNLAGITRKVPHDWLKSFILNPTAVIQGGDERGMQLYDQFKQYMPSFAMLKEDDLESIMAYMHTHEEKAETANRTEWGEPLKDPIPQKIEQSDFTLVIKEFAQVPPTADEGQRARINKMAPLYDGSKRLFVHDLRGKLYELKDGKPQLFLDLAAKRPEFIHIPGHGTGMGSFAFHPEYAKNGLFYTSHTENPETSSPADFTYADSLPAKVRWVLTEWKQDDPKSSVFEGKERELFRVDMVTQIHGMQEIAFNPLARPGDEDYGLLFIGIGDGGSVGKHLPFLVQDRSRVWGTILRIDPLATNGINGKYGFPSSNPFANDGDENTRGEIYAMGFRNPHRFTWDAVHGGKMLGTCIGQNFLEELNIIIKGGNYGWPEREGTFRLDKYADIGKVYPLGADDSESDFIYPVVQFDHDEALAISGGFVYNGSAAPDFSGKYIFGGIAGGRVFVTDAATLGFGHLNEIHYLILQLEDGTPVSWPDLTGNTKTGHNRIDLRFGIDADHELYILTKADGKIYKVTGEKRELSVEKASKN
ncbi:MAG: PQQ-dependent sugar dehydrogenase [Bacteroidia bacterium]